MASWTIDSIPAFCITLERRADRWRRFQDQPGIDGLNIKRFLGVDGKTLNIKTDPRITTLTKRNILANKRRAHEEIDSVGAIGCSLSHIAIWQWMVDNNQELVLVFEDDAVVPTDFVEKANQCIRNSNILKDSKKWDMWLLGCIWEDFTKIPEEAEMVRLGAFILSHGYIITNRTAKKFLKDVYPIHCHIDMWMSIYSYLENLRLVCCPTLNLQQSQRVTTDIQKETGCKICNVPTDFDKTHKLISKTELQIARVAEVMCVALIGYIVYQQFMKQKL